VTKELVRKLLPEELARVRALLGADGWAAGRYDDAAKLFDRLITSDEYVEFLTLPGYELLTQALGERVAA
jgi:malate synthase